MLFVYGLCHGNALQAVNEYRDRYPNRRTPSRAVFSNVYRTLRETGKVPSAQVTSERAAQQTLHEHEQIVNSVQRSPSTSTRKIARRIHVAQSRVWRTLHKEGLYPFHRQKVQHLHPDDEVQRLEFCHWLQHNHNVLPFLLFTDEAKFTRDGINNTRNSHEWDVNNPHATVESNFQIRFSINVWCGMIDDMLIGPVILDDRMTGERYLHFLQNELPALLEDVSLHSRCRMYMQHDGAPIHYTRPVIQHLNAVYPNRWIGRGSLIRWPARSPDLTPLDFCLWGWLKNEVYETKVNTREELLRRIDVACTNLKNRKQEIRRATQSTMERVQKCIAVHGRVFEHLL